GYRRHGLAGDRFDLALLPVLDVERLRDLAGRVVLDRRHHDVLLDAEHFRRDARERLGDRLVDFPIALAFPHGVHRRGQRMDEGTQVVDMRKSSVTSRSSFPFGASSRQTTSFGFFRPVSPRSLPCTPCVVPSRCLRKYSWPLPDEPSRFERHTNILRGQLSGWSGSSQASCNSPDFSALAT